MMTFRNFGLAGGTGSQQTLPYPYTFELEFECCSRSHNAAAHSPKHARGRFVHVVARLKKQPAELNHT